MDLDKVITNRYSVKDYKSKEIDLRLIGSILDTAKNAPSSGNAQNWRFIIVRDRGKKEKISRCCLDQLWMIQAPVHIVVCYDERNIKTLFPDNYEEFSIQNVAIISTLIMLKATDLDLGTCWVSVDNKDEISNLLKLPNFIKPSVVITLGHPKYKYKSSKRTSLDKLVYFEQFGIGNKQTDTSLFPLEKYIKRLKKELIR